MARTTSIAVINILRRGTEGGDYDDVNNPDLVPYIDTASALIDRVVTCAAAKGKSLTSVEAELLERWMAAFAYAMSDQTYASKSTSKASASFKGQSGMGLDANNYGQMAKGLDPSGCLAAIFAKKMAGGFWAGKTESEAIDYEDRQ